MNKGTIVPSSAFNWAFVLPGSELSGCLTKSEGTRLSRISVSRVFAGSGSGKGEFSNLKFSAMVGQLH